MPTYQYVCSDCGEPLEVVQKFSDDALTVCPNCQGNLRKVFSAVGVVFKGSGFYRNDSRDGKKSTVPAASGSSSESNGSNGSSSDSGSSNGSSDGSSSTKESNGSSSNGSTSSSSSSSTKAKAKSESAA